MIDTKVETKGTAVGDLGSTPSSTPAPKKFDWFVSDLAGANANFADMHHQGITADHFKIDDVAKYWGDEKIRTPFEQQYGDKGFDKFSEVYNTSKQRLKLYEDNLFDINNTSARTFVGTGPVEQKLESLGYGRISTAKPVDKVPNRTPWGAEELYRTPDAVLFSAPKHSIRQGAEKNGVMDKDGKLIPLDQYLGDNPDTNLVYAVNEDGSPKLRDGLNYLRPLESGEQTKTYEEIYGGKLNTYFGMNGITRPDNYWAKFIGKNTMNFAADVMDSGAEMLKALDNQFQKGDASAWDKALTQFQNNINSALYVPTSEEGKSKWYSTEGIVDGTSNVALQLLGMVGVAKGVSGLSKLAQMGEGTRAGSVASKFWMASLSSDDFIKQAREAGLTPKEQQLFYGLYMTGMYQLAGLSEKVIDPVKSKNIMAAILGRELAPLKAIKDAGGKVTPNGIFQATKNSLSAIKSSLSQMYKAGIEAGSGPLAYAAAGSTEALEEASEVLFDKTFKQSINSLYIPNASSPYTDTNKDARFNVSWETLPSELAASATLGFAGGLIARKVIKPEVMDTKTMLSYGAVQGGYERLNSMLDKQWEQDKVLPGGKTVDVMGNPTSKVEESKAYMVYKALKHEIASAEQLWKSTGMSAAFVNTEEKLKYITDSNLVKQTSIGADIAGKLARMTQLESDITDPAVTLTPEQTESHMAETEKIKKDLIDIKEGKYAAHYLSEGLYNIYQRKAIDIGLPPADLSFTRYDLLNKSLGETTSRRENALEVDKLTLEEVLSRKTPINATQASKLYSKLNEKFEVTFDDDGMPILPAGDKLDSYNRERKDIEELVFGGPLSVEEEFMRVPDPDGKPGKTFEEIIAGEEQREKSSRFDSDINTDAEREKVLRATTDIYDDVESLERVENNLYERLSQLTMTAAVNPDFNKASEKANLGVSHPEITSAQAKDIIQGLSTQLGRVATLIEVAKKNKENFFNSAMKSWDNQVFQQVGTLAAIGSTISAFPEYIDLGRNLSPLLTEAMNAEDGVTRQKKLFAAEQVIHDYFASDKKRALDDLWDKMGMDSGYTRMDDYTNGGKFMYLKSIVNQNPTQLRNAFVTVMNTMKDQRTPFPSQYKNIMITASSLLGGYNPLSKLPTTMGSSGLVEEAPLTESVFVNDEQGAGKTFVMGMAVRVAQVLKGGKAALFSLDNDLRVKNFKEFGEIGVDRDPRIAKGTNAQEILDYLNNPDNLKETNFIVIDEATLYSRNDVYQIDQRVQAINATITDDSRKIKILFAGDQGQIGAMDPNGESYNISGGRIDIDKTTPTRFSFRTGNQDVVAYLRHVRNIFNTFQSEQRPANVTFKYNWEKMNGVFVTNDFDKVMADYMKKKGAASKDFVIITEPEKMGEIKKKYKDKVSDDNLLTPAQAQGKQWKHVLVDLPIEMETVPDATKLNNIKTALSAAGRASEMLIMRNHPILSAVSGPGESIGKEAAFSEDEFTKLRSTFMDTMTAAGATELQVQTEPINRKVEDVERTVIVERNPETLDNITRDKIRNLLNALTPKAGHKNFLLHSFFSDVVRYNHNGEGEIVEDSATIQTWKKQLLYPSQFKDLDFDVDKTSFDLRVDPKRSTLVNRNDNSYSGKPNLLLYAKLYKNDALVGEMAVGAIMSVNATDLPKAKIEFTEEQSAVMLNMLQTDLSRAERDTVNQFKKHADDANKSADKSNKKNNVSLAVFKRDNPFYNYMDEVFHVTQSSGQKTPYLFYSPSMTPAQIREALVLKQVSQGVLANNVEQTAANKPLGKQLLATQLEQLKAMGIYSIPLDGGIQVPLSQFLIQLHTDQITNKSIDANHKLGDKAKQNLRNSILKKFNMDAEYMDDEALAELEGMKVKGMTEMEKYLRLKVIEFIRPVGNKHSAEEESKKPKKGVKIRKVSNYLHDNPFLASVYQDSEGSGKSAKYAKQYIQELEDTIFKYGVFKSSGTVKNSTNPVDAVFGEVNNMGEPAEYSVPLLMPEMPVFQVSEELIKNVINNNEMTGFTTKITTEYKPLETMKEEDGTDLDPTNEVLRQVINVPTDENGKTSIDVKGSDDFKSEASTMFGVLNKWFGNNEDRDFIEEFIRYFRKGVYDNLFRLENGAAPTIITQRQLHRATVDFKKALKENASKTIDSIGKADEIKKVLKSGSQEGRALYYNYVLAHEFDFLLPMYFSGIDLTNGVYTFVSDSYVFNPIADSKDTVSHLATGNDMVKMHLFNMPMLVQNAAGAVSYTNTLGKEDYVRLIRMVRDNDITDIDVAKKFFNPAQIQTVDDELKRSFFYRFLSPTPITVNGKKYHSLVSAKSNPYEENISNEHVTGLLSFLATGNETEFTKSVFETNSKSKRTGRDIDIEPSRFRADLENSIRSTHEVSKTVDTTLHADYKKPSGKKPERVELTFRTAGKRTKTWVVNKTGAGFFITDERGDNIDPNQTGWVLKATGIGEINHKFFNRILNRPSFRSSLFDIGKYLAQPATGHDIFSGPQLNNWVEFSNFYQNLKQVESAFGYTTLEGERAELISLSYPYVRTNQKIVKAKSTLGPLSVNPAVTGALVYNGYLIKEGFEDGFGRKVRPNSKMSVGEQFFYDFNELYLGGLAKSGKADVSHRIMINPTTFSDKGSDGVVQVTSDFLMKRGGLVDVQALKQRTITDIAKYYNTLGAQIVNTWGKVLDEQLGVKIPLAAPGEDIATRLTQINQLISQMTPEQRVQLVNTDLVSELMYTPAREGKMKSIGYIKSSLIAKMNPATLARTMEEDHTKFRTQAVPMLSKVNYPGNLDKSGLNLEEALDSYFWNWNWVAHSFNTLWIGPLEQYQNGKEYYDMVKRASQISTNRQRVITRSDSWTPGASGSLQEGRKMGKFSNTIIVSDFPISIPTISGGVKSQKVYDGASFFNIYSKIQMRASYGGSAGFNVGANLKPISTYMNPVTGAARYDKYASFEITSQMTMNGDMFIRKVNEQMMKSVPFTKPIMGASNLFELDQAGKAAGMTEEQIYDEMVKAGEQDNFVRELIFDTGVKTGQTNINDFGGDFNAFINNGLPLKTILRDNSEWGLILDASKDSNDSTARIASQFVSSFLQTVNTVDEAKDILGAIEKIGSLTRGKMETLIADDKMNELFQPMREAVNKRDHAGILSQIVNRPELPMSNKMLLRLLHSNIASHLSDETIRFQIFGGQQVLAPSMGVWKVVDDIKGTRIAKQADIAGARDLKGFDALKGTQSIKDHPLWIQLNEAVQTKNAAAASILRQELRKELKNGWVVQVPEIIISPIHFKSFGIPENTDIEEISPELFAMIDAENLHKRFDAKVMNEADELTYTTARDGNAASPEQLIAMRQPYIDKQVAERAAEGKYDRKYADFQKTLDVIFGRIPATFFQSLAPVKIVGFAHGSDNTAYVHPELLVLQGADQDIDKGNVMAYQPNRKGEVIIPLTLEEAGNDPATIKNFMLSKMIGGLNKPETMIESTLPTSTDNIDQIVEANGNQRSPLEGFYNPISNNEAFVRGQLGKGNVAIHASGLKAFSSLFYSAIKRGKTYSGYTPTSPELAIGRPLQLSGIDGGTEGLITFSENLQAAVDNAKDPKLGVLGIDGVNGGMVNTLAMFGYSEQQIVNFLANPIVNGYFELQRNRQNFFLSTTQKKELKTQAENILKLEDPTARDLAYFVKLADEMTLLTKVLKVNQEVPNSLWESYQYNQAFKKLAGITPAEFINMTREQRETKVAQYTGGATINLMEILNDNEHVLSYISSTDLLSKMMNTSQMYHNIVQAANKLEVEFEDQFNNTVELMYGLAVDEYLSPKSGAGRNVITMNGRRYDLSKVVGDTITQSRIDFMKDFPHYFTGLEPKRGDALTSAMRIAIVGDNAVLKPEGNFRDYSPEKKSKVKMQMTSVDEDVVKPDGDNSISNMLFLYSLIKDKGGMSGTQFTDLFDYNKSEFSVFDDFVQNRFRSPYLASEGDDLKELFANFNNSTGKDDNAASFMKQNKLFIPYTNDITLTDKVNVDISNIEKPTEGEFSAPVATNQSAVNYSYVKKSKQYIDTETKKAMSLATNRNMISSFASDLGRKLGVNTNVLTSDAIRQSFGQEYAELKGFVMDGVVYVNLDLTTIDTPLHEFSHVWLEGFRKSSRRDYDTLVQASLNHPYAEKVREMYPELSDEGIGNETFATLLGLRNAEKTLSSMNTGFFARLKTEFDKFMNWLNAQFLDIFGLKPSVNDSLLSVIDKVGESLLSSSFMGMSAVDRQVLKLLGVDTVSSENPLSSVRDRLKQAKRFEKICA